MPAWPRGIDGTSFGPVVAVIAEHERMRTMVWPAAIEQLGWWWWSFVEVVPAVAHYSS